MFAKSQQSSMFSLGGSGAAKERKPAKPLTAAEKYEQALVTANVFIEDSRGRMLKAMESYQAVAGSQYWFAGYFGANAATTLAVCLTLGNRWAFFRSYSGWFAAAGGYFGGKACQAAHSSVLMAAVIKQLDTEVAEAVRMDEQTEHIVPDYLREAERLKQVKYELMPSSPEAVQARAQHTELTLDDRADALVDAYLKRKSALEKN